MESILKRVEDRLVRLFEARLRKRTLRLVSDVVAPAFDTSRLPLVETPGDVFLVRTESSPDIANLPSLRARARLGRFSRRWSPVFDGGAGRVRFRPGGFDVDSAPGTPARWVFLQQKTPLPEPFALSFDLALGSEFTEFQIAFQIRHLLRRCRFILVDNRDLGFEVVDRGAFLRSVRSVPLRLEPGGTHRMEILFSHDGDVVRLDGRPMISVAPKLGWTNRGPAPFGIILFEKGPDRPIRASVSSLRLGPLPEA